MKAIIYCRVSTGRQAKEGVSLEAQEQLSRAWCELNGFEHGKVFVDAGMSGKRADNRPELQKALSEVKKGDALVFYSLSRLARSTRDAITIKDQLQKKGCRMASLTEPGLDTSTPMGEMIFTVIAGFAQLESAMIGQRVSMGHQHNKAKGRFTGGKRAPYGFKRGADGKTLEPVEAEQEVIALVKKHRTEGLTLRAISTELERAGILNRTNKPFAPTQVSRIAEAA